MRRALVVIGAVLLAAACSSSAKSSSGSTETTAVESTKAYFAPLPPDPMKLAREAGLVPETAERLQYHVHAHLDIFVNGAPKLVPGGIGIRIDDPQVHSGPVNGYPSYGGISEPCATPCISPLHTHDVTGVIHTESATAKNNTLGQLFTEWDVRLDQKCVDTYCRPATPIAIYENGKLSTGDPRTIALSNFKEIAVVIGTPPAKIPQSWNPGQ
jgi:hypothetical protein